MREILVVHDATCGTCTGVVRDLPHLLRVPVRARSCRDPDLPADLPPAARTCRAPAIGLVRADGTVRWRLGVAAAPALLRVTRPGRLPAAVRVLLTVRRTSRARTRQRR